MLQVLFCVITVFIILFWNFIFKTYTKGLKKGNDSAGTLLMLVKVVLCTTPRSAVLNLGAINVYGHCEFQVGSIEMS